MPGLPASSTPTPVEAQMSYLMAHYDDRNVGEFGQRGGADCVNFASQGLLARGWTMTAEWWHDNMTCKTQESGRRARR